MASSDSDNRPRKRRSHKRSKHRRRSESISSDSSISCDRRKKRRKKEKKKLKRSRDDDSSSGVRRKKSHKKRRKKDRGTSFSDTEDASLIKEATSKDGCSTSTLAASATAPTNPTKSDSPPNKPSAAKGPMTQAQYQQLHSQIHEVIDPHTGRTRWQRGTGEIVERIVSREQHMNLNLCATRGDGASFGRDIVHAALRR